MHKEPEEPKEYSIDDLEQAYDMGYMAMVNDGVLKGFLREE